MELLLGIFVIIAIIIIFQVILSIFLNKIPKDRPSLISRIIGPIFILVSVVLILLGIVIPFSSEEAKGFGLLSALIGIILLPFSISYYREKYTVPKYKQSHPSFEEKREQINDLATKSSEEFQARHFQ